MREFLFKNRSRISILRWSIWFCLLESLVLILLSLRFQNTSSGPLLAELFSVLMRVGHFGGWGLIGLVALGLVTCVYPRGWLIAVLGITLALLANIIVLIDSFVYALYRLHINTAILELLFGDAKGDIFVFDSIMYLQAGLYATALLIITMSLGYAALRFSSLERSRSVEKSLVALSIISAILQNGVYAWADAVSYTPITNQARLLPGYLPTTMRRAFRDFGIVPAEAAAFFEVKNGENNLLYPINKLNCTAPNDTPNIIFVVMDSWRFDTLSKEITPNIAKFVPQGLSFSDHWSGGSATRTGLFSLFYALPATYWHEFLSQRRGPVFIDELRKRDYALGIFGSARLTSPEFNRTIFVDLPDLRLISDGATTVERDLDINRDFLQFLYGLNADKRFFSLLFYDAPHSFAIPTDYPLKFTPSLESVNYLALTQDYNPLPFFNRYLNSIHFVDSLIGDVVAALSKKKLLDDTIIVFTGDHGQEFNENGLNYWGHNGNFTRYQVGVPLLIYWPGKEKAVFANRTSHFDVVPTLMQEVFQCSNKFEDYSVGKNLFEAKNPSFLLLANYGEHALVEDDRINILSTYGGVEIVDNRYRELPNATIKQSVIKSALEQQTRFFRR